MKNSSFDSRLDKLSEQIQKAQNKPKVKPSGASIALRMGTEMVAGVMVGTVFGYGVDRLFGTLPIFLVIFLFIGAASGIRMMMQTSARHNQINNELEE